MLELWKIFMPSQFKLSFNVLVYWYLRVASTVESTLNILVRECGKIVGIQMFVMG
jgi:hypothetical protein